MTKLYLHGHPGTGKSSRLESRLVDLIASGTRPDRILVLVPQNAQSGTYRAALARVKTATRGEPAITTIYGLAQQHVGLFFPRIAARAGFADPAREPVFINVEAAQYFLDQILAPRITEFDDLRMARPRLISQILDDLGKSAICGFPLDELSARLSSAWNGTEPRAHSYQRVQQIAQDFRAFCLQHGLLDFSLWMQLFGSHLLNAEFYKEYVAARYRHVLVDNVEEGTPIQHDFVALLLGTCDSAMLVEDDPGGYRLFLGADRVTARGLRELCDTVEEAPDPRLDIDALPAPAQFGVALMQVVQTNSERLLTHLADTATSVELLGAGEAMKYWANMVRAVAERIVQLVGQGAQPGDIAVLAPFVEDVLRFELQERLKPHDIGVRSLRPSRPLYDHPVTRTLATWAKLAHESWGMPTAVGELARALSVSIADLDIVRAQLIADAAHKITTKSLPLVDDGALWNRVGMRFREPFVLLQKWLVASLSTLTSPLDLFWQQLFTDVLSQAGFGLNTDLEGATVYDRVVKSAREFRQVFTQARLTPTTVATVEVPQLGLSPQLEHIASQDIGQAFVQMLMQGLLAASSPLPSPSGRGAGGEGENQILLAPTFAYLTSNLRSRYQFWLDINTNGWHERIYQPLTHPYVLARTWQRDQQWRDEDELYANRDMLARLVGGLAMRCDERIFLAQSQLNVAGSEESGALARAIQRVMVDR